MRISITEALSKLPLPATPRWPEGVWDVDALSHGSMSLLLFTPRGKDYQSSHTQDELYIVVKGQGILVVDEVQHPFAAGDALFVRAGQKHHFEQFSDDLTTWAVFWGKEGGE